MAPRLKLVAHLSGDEIYLSYRRCKDLCAKSYWHVVWLKSKKMTTAAIAEATGFNPAWIRKIIHRYNVHGPDALRDHRQDNGRQSLLDEDMQVELLELLQKPASDGGLWTSRKVGEWIHRRTGVKIHKHSGWRYLQRLDMTLQRPRPRNALANQVAQDEFKKNFP